MENKFIAQIGKYILKKNELKKKRQQFRSKAGYYNRLLNTIGKEENPSWVRGWKKWNKPGKKQLVRVLHKKYLIEQLRVEVEMHELVISTRKELNKIRKQIPFNIPHGCDYIEGIQIKAFGSNFDKVIRLDELEQIVIDQEAENILLRGVV